jgi:hypothetical protein
MIDDTEVEIRSRLSSNRPPDDDAQARAHNANVLSGRLKLACQNLTSSNGGGVLWPDDKCTKTGRPVIDVLLLKHPDLREPPSVGSATGAFEPHDDVPTAMTVDITADDIEAIATRLSGAAGPGGADAVDLRNWLPRFGKESEALRDEMARWAAWLANDHPPWAAYRALMAARLVALDKQPGVRPVGIGEVWRRLFSKVLLKVIGSQARAACGNCNLCAGLPAGIEGAAHAVCSVFEEQEAATRPPAATQPKAAAQPSAEVDPEEMADLMLQPSVGLDTEELPGLMTQLMAAAPSSVEDNSRSMR